MRTSDEERMSERVRAERGQTTIEYVLVIVLIVLVVVVAFKTAEVGKGIKGGSEFIATTLENANASTP